MYNQTYENREITQSLIDKEPILISALDFVDCTQAQKVLTINLDTRICRGKWNDLYFQNHQNSNMVFLIQIWGAEIDFLKTSHDSNLIANTFDDDAPDGKAIRHADLIIKRCIIEGQANLHNAAIEHLQVQEYGNVVVDSPIGDSHMTKAVVYGTLHVDGTVPCEQIDVAPGGRVRIWNIDHATDVKVRGLVRDCYIKYDETDRCFWYYG